MAISPWYMGQLAPSATITLTYDGGTVVDLTGNTGVVVNIRNEADGTTVQGAGTATVANAAGGVISYVWAASDVANEGRYTLRPVVTMAGGKPLKCDPIPWTLLP